MASQQSDTTVKSGNGRAIRIAVIIILGIISVLATFMIKKKELDKVRFGINDTPVQYEQNVLLPDGIEEV